MSEPEREIIRTTCPRDCYDACGMIAVREGGAVRKILGDPSHHVARGSLCGKCAIAYNGVWRDPAARLVRPLKRIGPKGAGAFAPISWTEALEILAAQLRPHLAARPATRVVHAHYTGTVGLVAGWFPLRFFQYLGATEVDPDTVCNKAGHTALSYVFGDSLDGFDPESARDAAVIVVWGANPSHSAPHMHSAWLRETHARVIAIDPLSHRTATERAALHLKLRPGTDAALAFGFMHVAMRDGLLDRSFIDRQVSGFEALVPAIEAADPRTTEARTGVAAALIEEAARAYATGPSLLWMGQGLQRTARGGNAMRAIAALAAITGNVGRPGAGTCYMNGPATRGIDMAALTPPQLDAGAATVSHMDLAAVLAEPARSEVFFAWNCNPLASSPDQTQLRAALSREDLFTVVCELFATDTAAYADLILPSASFLEFDDLVVPYFHHTLSAQVKVQEPPGEALPNQEIFRRLARALGLEEPLLLEEDGPLLDRLVAMTPYRGDFRALAGEGTVRLFAEPRLQFSGRGFPTRSGRIEVASEAAAAAGLPYAPEPHADPPAGEGRLRLLSPASVWQMNSCYANDPAIRRKLGPISVLLHPEEARRRGLSDGDHVVLSNEVGALTVAVTVSEVPQPGVCVVYKGRWPSAEPGRANVNVLHRGGKADLGGSTAVHSLEVALTRAEAAL